jgi:hypothetical protein
LGSCRPSAVPDDVEICRNNMKISGTDVMILKIFSPKNFAKNGVFLFKTKLNYGKNDHNIVF